MKYLPAISFLVLITCRPASAQTAAAIAKGTVLYYDVTEEKVKSKLRATVTAYSEGEGPVSLSWQMTGGRAAKGTVHIAGPARENARHFSAMPTPGAKTFAGDSIPFFLSELMCDVLESEGRVTVIDDQGYHTAEARQMLKDDVTFLYNGKRMADDEPVYRLTEDGSDFAMQTALLGDCYLVSYYKTAGYELRLTAVKTPAAPAKKPVPDLATFLAGAEKNKKLLRMAPGKLAMVSQKYPVLAAIEKYDPTAGGTVKKPFSETYDYRISSGTAVPPTLIDCFIADLTIVAGSSYAVSSHSVPGAAVSAAVQKYVSTGASDLAGYRPWSHWSFVRSLSEKDREALAAQTEAYAREYGYIDVD